MFKELKYFWEFRYTLQAEKLIEHGLKDFLLSPQTIEVTAPLTHSCVAQCSKPIHRIGFIGFISIMNSSTLIGEIAGGVDFDSAKYIDSFTYSTEYSEWRSYQILLKSRM